MSEAKLVLGYWWFPEELYTWDPRKRPEWKPTGALWVRAGRGALGNGAVTLTCCMLDGTWCPISERGIPAYAHTSLMERGLFVAFVVDADPWPGPMFQVVGARCIQPWQVEELYGREAGERARTDVQTTQVRLLVLPKPLVQLYDEERAEVRTVTAVTAESPTARGSSD